MKARHFSTWLLFAALFLVSLFFARHHKQVIIHHGFTYAHYCNK